MKRLFISMLVVFLLTSFSSIAISAGLNQITDVLTVQKELVNPDSEDTATAKTNYVAELNKIGMAGRSESDNAAPYYQKAIELFVEQPEGLKVSASTWPKDYPAQEQAMLKKWVQDNSRALEQLQLAGQKPYYWLKHTGQKLQATEMPQLSTIRQLAFALQNRAMLSAEDGNITSALNDIETLYTIGAQMSAGPKPLVEKLVGIAVKSLPIRVVYKMLDRKMLDNNSMKSLEDRFKQLVATYSEPFDIRGEKLFMQEQVETDPQYSGLKPYLKSTLEYYDTATAKTPLQLHNETQSATEQNPLIKTAGSGIPRIIELENRSRTDEQALITTLALLRYNAGSDSYPKDLQQLVSAGYIKEVPKDPFSNNPLVYKQTRDGFTLYSFGDDYDDDGGQPIKRGARDEGGDQVFWPVEQTQTAQRQPRRDRERGPYARSGPEDGRRNVTTAQQSDTSDLTLHDAVRNGDINQVQSLLSKGADVNLKNRMNWTPLHTAVQNRRQEIAELLIAKGADLNATNNRQQTPLYVAVNTNQKEIVELLISKGADVNIMSGSDNALTIAQRKRYTEIVDILVKNGAKEPSPQDLMGDRYYPGGASPYSTNQEQASAPSRSTRGSRGSRAAIQPVEVDILADPNEIKARIKTFAGLQKALDDVAVKGQSETRQWEQTRYDNRTMLVRTVQKQFEDEMNLIRTVSVSEKAKKTTEAIDSTLSLRQERFKVINKELLAQKREERESQQTSTRSRSRGRTSTRGSTRGGYGTQNEQYDSADSYGRSSSGPYGRGSTSTRMGRSGAIRPPSQQAAQPVDREAENESRQWLQASFEDKSDLASAVNEQIQLEITSIRDVAVEEAAKKTTAAIDGLLLARKMRHDAYLLKMEELLQTQQRAQDPRTTGRYQQNTRSIRGGATRGGTTGGYQQGSQSRTRRRR